jgi:hypothetical protein
MSRKQMMNVAPKLFTETLRLQVPKFHPIQNSNQEL